MKKLIVLLSPILFFACDTSGDCGCEVYEIVIKEDGAETYKYLGNRSGYCSQYDDLEGFYYYDVNCD